MMNGILLIDKPRGWSSFDVIRKLRGPLEGKKMGHAGTLDPMATGLLIVLVGNATKKQDQFMKLGKTYETQITLGATSTTDDTEGEIISSRQQAASSKREEEIEEPTHVKVKEVLRQFTGEIEQVPPRHSAVKVEGKRAYKLAREGYEVELKPRLVTIYEIMDFEYEYPLLRFTAHVSSGTYLRSLARDIGEALGAGGYLSSLRRTQIGEYKVTEAIPPSSSQDILAKQLISIDE